MNDSGKISVELRLALNQLQKDVKAAAEMLKAGLSSGMQGVTTGTANAGKEMDKLEAKTRKVNNALKDQKKIALEAWRASLPQPQVHLNGNPNAKRPEGLPDVGTGPWQGPGSGGGLASPPTSGRAKGVGAPPAVFPIPRPPVIQPQPPVITPNLQSAVTTAQTAIQAAFRTPLAIAAQLGAALAGLRVIVGLVKYAFNQLIAPLRMAAAAADAARAMYAKSLTSGGLPMQFVARRSVLADVIGVSEEQVFQYAGAVSHLNNKVRYASEIFATTNSRLTALGWEFRVLMADISATGASILHTFQPALVALVRAIDMSVRGIGLLAKTMAPFIKLAMIATPIGFMSQKSDAPAPQASMQRLAASAWEKMGLVLGNGGANHAKATADNTKRMADIMHFFLQTYAGPGYTNQQSIPSTP